MWKVESYLSGTVIVTNVEDPTSPHFYVYGKTGSTESERYNIAIDLATWINYATRMPLWALELKVHPDTNTCLITDSGISITATGPMVLPENDNGALNWMESYSDENKYAREQLIKNLLFNRKNTEFAYSQIKHPNPSYNQ